MNATCLVYVFDDRLIVSSMEKLKSGMGMEAGFYAIIANDSDAITLGKSVMDALNSYRGGVPDPSDEDFRVKTKERLRVYGVKSWKELEKKAKLIDVTLEGRKILVMPTRRDKAYLHLPNKTISTSNDPQAIGLAVFDRLAQCE